MATTLYFKIFDISENGDLTVLRDELYHWFSAFGPLNGRRVAVRVETVGNTCAQKKTALRQLEELIVDSAVEDGGTTLVWEQSGYRFRFVARHYCWNGKEIHITANEALFLYRWLVRDEDICKTQMYYLRNMRRRLGKEFLEEIQNGQT
jgi:hypothetical protein